MPLWHFARMLLERRELRKKEVTRELHYWLRYLTIFGEHEATDGTFNTLENHLETLQRDLSLGDGRSTSFSCPFRREHPSHMPEPKRFGTRDAADEIFKP